MAFDEADWERQIAEAWASFDTLGEQQAVALIERLVAELPPDSAVASYELGSLQDSTGHSDRAVALYRQALERGLAGSRRREAVVQLASSLRNLGQARESVELLSAELE